MSEEETKQLILQDLKKNSESSIIDISRRLGISQSTVSKYLGSLKGESKVTVRNVLPRKYYKLKGE